MTVLSHYTQMIPPKLKEQWNRLPANTALIGGALIAAAGIGYLGYRFATQEPLHLSARTIAAVKRAAETTPMALGSGQIVNIHGANYLIVKKEDGLPDAFILSEKTQKLAGTGSQGAAKRVYSLYTNTYSKVLKTVATADAKWIENAIQMVSKCNPDGKTRGCIKTPYPVTEMNAQGQLAKRGALMDAYDSDAHVAANSTGLLGTLHTDPNSEIYHLDMLHQALSILVKLQETNVTHRDITVKNIFVSRDADGFIQLHLGDWDNASDQEDAWIMKNDHILLSQALYDALYRSSPNNKRLPIILKLQHLDSNPKELLTALNQELIFRATRGPTSLWPKAAERAGLIPGHS